MTGPACRGLGTRAAGRLLVAVTLAIIATVGAGRAASPAYAQAPGDPRAVARIKLVDGGEALKRGDYRDALTRFKEAYDLVPSPKIHYNFGLAYRGLGRPADAIEAFEKFLVEANDASPDLRANAERFRSELVQQVGTVVLTCDVEGAEISVDGRSHGVTPARAPLRLDPGPHQIVVEKTPAPPFTRKVELGAGQRETVAVALAKEPAPREPAVVPAIPLPPPPPLVAPPQAPPAPEEPPVRPHSWKWKAGWGLAAGGVAFLGFGFVERLSANSKFREFNGAMAEFGPCDADGRARQHGGARCAALLSDGNSAATKATLGFAAGGVLAAGGAALLVLTWNENAEPAPTKTALTCAPDFTRAGLHCAIAF
jgi:hypothetical protein